MIRKLRVKPVICFALIFAFVCTSLANIMTKSAQAAPNSKELSAGYLNATEKYLNFNQKDNMTFDFNIKMEAQQKGANYTWYVKADKGDPGAVSINSKTGVVTAKKAGTSYIRCKITLPDGSVIRPEAKVVVRNNITDVDISNMPKDQTITLGEAMDFDRVILNTDAGKGKRSQGITRWELDKDTAGVKEITDNGVVKPASVGSFAIRAVSFQSKDKYALWLKDKAKNSSYITAASKWYEISVTSEEEVKVATQKELDLALADSKIGNITIATDKEISFTIAKGSYSDKTIVVDAPNAEVENYGIFKKITILAIKENTWNENAEGNSFHVTSVKVRIIVNGNAEVREIVFDRANSVINVEVEGKVHQITILQPSEINLSGNGEQVPITIEETAEGSKLTTSIPLLIEAHNDSEVIINPGAEGTKINKSAAEDTVSVVNNSSASVGVTTENAGEEQVEAGKSVVVGGTPTTTPTPTIIPAPYFPPSPIGPSLSNITIKMPATKTVYKVGEILDITGLVIEGSYSDGSSKTETITIANIRGFNSTAVAASQTLTVYVGGKTAGYTISVIKADGPALTGVSRDDALNTLSGMATGMEFSIDGGTTWTAYNAAAPNLPDLTGDTVIRVRYAAIATHEAGAAETFTFTAGELLSIAIKTPANQLVYFVGQELDITGLVIEGEYSDGGKRPITITPTNIKGFNSSATAESQTLTIEVEGKTTTYTIKINPLEDITSITVIFPARYPGSFAANAADVQAATNDPDFTVTGISWNNLTGYGSYPEHTLLTVEVTLTSKNYKQFQSTSYNPVIAGASSVSTTTTYGNGIGNTVKFTAQFSVGYIIESVADKPGYVTGGNGTLDNPKVYTVTVEYNSDSLTVGDIQAAANASVKLYANPDFSTDEITGSNSIPLLIGNNTVYIKASTADTTRYYIINIKRVNGDNNIKSIFGKTVTGPTGEGTVESPSSWEITVENNITELNASNIELPISAKAHYYSDASFRGTYEIYLPYNLSEGKNDIYIYVQAEDYSYKFHKVTIDRLPPKEIDTVEDIAGITVVYGTEISKIGLPDMVTVTYKESSGSSLPVTWDAGTPSYDGNTAGNYIFKGTLTLPEGVINPDAITASVTVIVEEKAMGKEPLTAAINSEYADGAERTELKLTQVDYTAESWTAYTDAIQAGIVIEEKEDTTQVQIEDAIEGISTAKAVLVFAGKANLDTAKAEAALFSEVNHSPETWALLTAALALPETTNAQVLYKTDQITDAVGTLSIELANMDIANAKALIPDTMTMVEGTFVSILDALSSLKDMSDYGVTLSVSSTDNSNIDTYGNITYTDTEVIGNVTISISKGSGTVQTVSINVTVPKKITYSIKLVNEIKSPFVFDSCSLGYDGFSVCRGNFIEKGDDSGTITNIEIHFEGPDADAFTYTPIGTWTTTLIDPLDACGFQFYPVNGLAPGTYEAIMVITADHGIRHEFTLNFTVLNY